MAVSGTIPALLGVDSETFYGVIKSFNERRGFGFISCEETSQRFGRDVYLSKEEALTLSQETLDGKPATGTDDAPSIQEGHFVQFQVQPSSEGYPQAVHAHRILKVPERKVESFVEKAPSSQVGTDASERLPLGLSLPSAGQVPQPPLVPQLIPVNEVASRSLIIRWPTVLNATAYNVELYEETSGSLERFHRPVPEDLKEALVELRVANLSLTGSYGVCVRSIGANGYESLPSGWSFLPPLYPPLPGPWPAMPPVTPQVNGLLPPLSALPLTLTSPPPPPPAAPPSVQDAAFSAPEVPEVPVIEQTGRPAPAEAPTAYGWRAPSGNLVPSPCAPELLPLDEVGCRSLLIRWPTVVHATAYIVELYEETSGTFERFQRSVPENLREVLVELRVGNLLPSGYYGVCVKCVAPCGFESAPSGWSFAPPLFPPPIAPSWPPPLPQANAAPLPGFFSPPLLATNPGSVALSSMPPPPPSEPPAVKKPTIKAQLPAAPTAAAVIAAATNGSAEATVLVLD